MIASRNDRKWNSRRFIAGKKSDSLLQPISCSKHRLTNDRRRRFRVFHISYLSFTRPQPYAIISRERPKHGKKDLMSIMSRRIAAGISLFLFASTSLLVAQNQAPSRTQEKAGGAATKGPAQSLERGSPAAAKVPDHARAYYHY